MVVLFCFGLTSINRLHHCSCSWATAAEDFLARGVIMMTQTIFAIFVVHIKARKVRSCQAALAWLPEVSNLMLEMMLSYFHSCLFSKLFAATTGLTNAVTATRCTLQYCCSSNLDSQASDQGRKALYLQRCGDLQLSLMQLLLLQMNYNSMRVMMEERGRVCSSIGSSCPPLSWTISNRLTTLAPFVLSWHYR